MKHRESDVSHLLQWERATVEQVKLLLSHAFIQRMVLIKLIEKC